MTILLYYIVFCIIVYYCMFDPVWYFLYYICYCVCYCIRWCYIRMQKCIACNCTYACTCIHIYIYIYVYIYIYIYIYIWVWVQAAHVFVCPLHGRNRKNINSLGVIVSDKIGQSAGKILAVHCLQQSLGKVQPTVVFFEWKGCFVSMMALCVWKWCIPPVTRYVANLCFGK